MKFSTPTVTVVPLIIHEGQLKAILSRDANLHGELRSRLVVGEVDPDQDRNIELCAHRLITEQFGGVNAAIVECTISTGRDMIGEANENAGGDRMELEWGIRAFYMALLRPSNLEAILKQDVDLIELRSIYSISPFPDEDTGKLEIAGREIDKVILAALKMADAHITRKAQVTKLPAFLAEREFTLLELQDVYEAASGFKIDPANFRRKVQQLGMVTPVGERRAVSRRPSKVYTLLGAMMELDRNIFRSG